MPKLSPVLAAFVSGVHAAFAFAAMSWQLTHLCTQDPRQCRLTTRCRMPPNVTAGKRTPHKLWQHLCSALRPPLRPHQRLDNVARAAAQAKDHGVGARAAEQALALQKLHDRLPHLDGKAPAASAQW
jgi:hypothetical protein